MRITNKMIQNSSLNSLTQNLQKMNTIQEQLSSGKIISRPSDDPIITSRVLGIKTTMAQNDQYTKNIDDNISWLNFTDTALGNLTSALHRVKELAVEGSNSILPQESRNAMAQEVDQLKKQFVDIGNTNYDGRYIFSGQKTMVSGGPFKDIGGTVTYAGDNGRLTREVAPSVTLDINVTGKELFMDTNTFPLIQEVSDAIKSGDVQKLSSDSLGKLDTYLDKTLELRTQVGAKVNRLQISKSRMDDQNTNFKELLSQFQDIDVSKVVMEMTTQQNVYQTSLAATAKTIQPSLLDYLR